MLALVIGLLVFVVAGVVLHDALDDGGDQRATTTAPRERAHRRPTRPRRRRPLRARRPTPTPTAPPPSLPPRRRAPAPGRHPWRSAVALLMSSAGLGVLLALTMGGLVLLAMLVLRAAVDA